MNMFASPGISLSAIEASGTKIKTLEYGELIDFQSGCWAAVLGHNRPEIVETIKENVGLLLHTHHFFDTEHPGALVEEITSAANLKSSYMGSFLSSGSEAVSLAVMLAELITGKHKKLSLSISYLGASPSLRIPRKADEWLDLDIVECLNCTKNSSCSACAKFSSVNFSQMAAFVFEPGNSGGLVLCPPEKLITFLAEEIRNSGGFVVVNEVTTGFGRTGKWFGFQHYGIFDSEASSPDFIAMGKGLGNGYPISGVLVRSNLAKKIEATGFRYVQSHSNDPLGCIISKKVVEIMKNENLVEHGNEMGVYFRSKLSEISRKTGGIIEIRGRGMMNVAVLGKSYNAKETFKALIDKGFFTGYSEIHNFIQFYSPITIEKEDLDALCYSIELILQSNQAIDGD
ncbi:MAG: gabT1 [Clostridiales bacterium]|nr:gabT1 [Clostridiales bacterium]